MPNPWPAPVKTRPKAYEIPTWAIANAIRRRLDKAKAVVQHVSEPQSSRRETAVKSRQNRPTC